MHNNVELSSPEYGVERGSVADVANDEFRRRRQSFRVSVAQIVEHGDRVPCPLEMSRDCAAYVAGATDNQNVAHATISWRAIALTPSPGEQTKMSGFSFVAFS